VEQLDARSSMEALLEKTKNHHNSDEVNYPKNYTVLIAVFTLLKDQFFTILCGIGMSMFFFYAIPVSLVYVFKNKNYIYIYIYIYIYLKIIINIAS